LTKITFSSTMRITLTIACLFLATCIFAQKGPEFLSNHNARWVDSTLQTMSLDQKIGQMLMPRGNYSGKGYNPEKILQWVRDYHLGGIVFFAGQPSVQARITNQLQAISKIPMLIGEDLEWGLAMRLDSTVRYPYQMTLGAIAGNEGMIEAMGREIGRQCKRMGVHVNYAPVVDINNNPNNPVINFRSFGEDKYNVTRKALAYMRGMQSQHILASAKHFPGHGDTGVDSHFDLPLIAKTKQQLMDLELYPYQELIKNGLSGVMTAHLSIPALDSSKNLASTLSPKIVTDLLRKELGFQGLVFTDAMDMEGAVKYYPNGEALVKAVLAGNELIETFEDVPTAFKAIKKAVADGLLKEADLNQRVRRILMAKSWVGLDKYRPIELKNLITDLNTIESDLLNRQMAEGALTLIKNQNNALPIRDLTQKIAVVSIDVSQQTAFQKMASNYTAVDHFVIPVNAPDSSIQKVRLATQKYDLIVIGVHLQNIRPGAKYGLTESNQKALSLLTAGGKSIVSIFGNPYTLDKIPALEQSRAVVMAYQFTNYMEEAAAQAIFGAIPMQGKLPVTVNAQYPLGMGINSASIGRLAYGVPEMVGIRSQDLIPRVDSLINLGLREKAYPGAVVEIARAGRVIYQKSYGYHTFEAAANNPGTVVQANFQVGNKNDVMDEKPILNTASGQLTIAPISSSQGRVQVDDLYDLASVTKISTSALAVMQLMSANKFDLNKTFADYYPEFAQSNKGNLRFRDLLTHRAGLRPFIPFWTADIDSVQTVKNSLAYQQKYAAQLRLNFFQRLFGGKKKLDRKIAAAIRTDKNLWKDCFNASSKTWKPGVYSSTQSAEYPIQMTDQLWLRKDYQQTIFEAIKNSPIKPEQGYVYSDLHYMLYPTMMGRLAGMEWETYLKQTYRAIGANTLTYNPLRFYDKSRIAPTEIDSLFRHTLVHGQVHDEAAAQLNGVSGHAGLFGNANDLTKLMQLYLQKGYYGGQQFIKPEVVDTCTRYQFPELNNRRGIAFDKLDFNKKIANGPQLGSPESYGHSGFTGTFTWIDPKTQTIYVFMSNRVYPTRENGKIGTLNIRTGIGDIIYQSIKP